MQPFAAPSARVEMPADSANGEGAHYPLGVARAQPISMSYPLITTVLAATFLGEAITLQMLVGIVLVVCGVYLVATTHGKHGRAGLARRSVAPDHTSVQASPQPR